MNSKLVIRNLKVLFYITFTVQLVFFVSFAFQWINISPNSTTIPIALERYTLLITMLSIPGALKLYSMIMSKNKHPEDTNFTTALYRKAYITRFGILFFVATLNIILYAISFNKNFMLLTLITFTAYIFSYPSEGYLNITEETEDEKDRKE